MNPFWPGYGGNILELGTFISLGLLIPTIFRRQNITTYFKVLLGLFVTLLIITLIQSRRDPVLFLGVYYWGVHVGPFIALLIAMTLKIFDDIKFCKFFVNGIFIFFLLTAFGNFLKMNFMHQLAMHRESIRSDTPNCKDDFFLKKDEYGLHEDARKVLLIKHNPEETESLLQNLPRQYSWLRAEMKVWQYKNKLINEVPDCSYVSY